MQSSRNAGYPRSQPEQWMGSDSAAPPPTAARLLASLPGDWSVHTQRDAWPISCGRAFLADAVSRLGMLVDERWDGREPSWAAHKRMPELPYVNHAFHKGQPVASVHDVFGDIVKSILSPSAYRANTLFARAFEEQGQVDYVLSFVREPDTGEPILAPLLRAKTGEDMADPVTYEHWHQVWFHTHTINSELDGAERRLPRVAARFLQLVQIGRLRTYARSINGSPEPVQLSTNLWEVDSALPRIASCGLNVDRPMNAEAPITHWIFVDRSDLERELEAAAPGQPKPVPASYSDAVRDECFAWLLEQFRDPATAKVSKSKFEEQAMKLFPRRLSHRAFLAAWQQATETFPERRAAGRRRGI